MEAFSSGSAEAFGKDSEFGEVRRVVFLNFEQTREPNGSTVQNLVGTFIWSNSWCRNLSTIVDREPNWCFHWLLLFRLPRYFFISYSSKRWLGSFWVQNTKYFKTISITWFLLQQKRKILFVKSTFVRFGIMRTIIHSRHGLLEFCLRTWLCLQVHHERSLRFCHRWRLSTAYEFEFNCWILKVSQVTSLIRKLFATDVFVMIRKLWTQFLRVSQQIMAYLNCLRARNCLH